ncbi:glycoside hydrolase family 72 protein [Armillaria gallica]|jgi:1,3-beta-glucanosyltransferase GAS1|uniref:1,3-beta-glucanosyltransferase n=1 Tax=Armillaria gallica TaxID=47427 RepID=A0A2H3E465_ARMGA|nr:glycoside hydrolase family 72 protein [Armillaria gallica]
MLSKAGTVTALLAAASSFVSSVYAISKITRSGRYLYEEGGTRFYIKGIAYQEQGAVVASSDNAFGEPSTFIDPLSSGSACSRDLPFLQQLGVNTIRLYSVNSSLNHDACMKTFSDAGIYTIIDLALPLNGSIDRTSPSWSTNIMDQYLRTIDVFDQYDNVLAYNVGNEVVIANGTAVAPYVKAAARDIKAYLQSKSSSALVGYSSIDGDTSFRLPLANFFSCDPSGDNSGATAIDIYGLNEYAWCGDSTFEASYANIEADYLGYNVVAYFSEFGCITGGPRLWTETQALFSSQMSDVWSGGIAFSYFPATSVQGQFGMVNISSDGSTVTTGDDFARLKTEYGQISPPNSPSQSSATTTYPACPTTNDTFAASSTLPPTPNEDACNCLFRSLDCQFTPQTSNYSAIVGELINTACSLLGSSGGSCDDIGGSGANGTYGRLSGCDPTIKLSYVMSEYYERNNKDAQACSFSGNGTVNSAASNAVATSAATSCVSNPSATFVPSSPATLAGGSGGSSSTSTGSSGSSGSSGGGSNGAVEIVADRTVVFGVFGLVAIGVISGVWTLL